MGRRIESVTSRDFDALFTNFEHTAYRLETLQVYDVSYEVEPYQAFISGHPQPHDPAKNAWVSTIRDAVQAGKIFQRVRSEWHGFTRPKSLLPLTEAADHFGSPLALEAP